MSQLSDIQQEILRRFQRPRTTPGYAGGELKDQLERDQTQGKPAIPVPAQQPNDQVLTSRNQAAITRPRSVFAPPEQVQQSASAPSGQAAGVFAPPTNQPFGSSGQSFEAGRARRTQPRDYGAEDAARLGELERQPRNWKDKTVDTVRALNQVFGNPKIFVPTKKEREIAGLEQRIERRLGEDRTRAQTIAVQTKPVFEQQRIEQGQQRIDNQKTMNQSRIDNWKSMRAEQRKARIVREYQAGMLNDPDSLEYAADELEIPGELRTKFINGELKNLVNEKGQIVTQNQGTGEIKPTGITSYEATKEAGRERRATNQINAANTRAANNQAAVNARASGRGGRGGASAPRASSAQQQKRINDSTDLHNEVLRNRKIAEMAGEALKGGDPNATITIMGANGEQKINAKLARETALRGASEAATKLRRGYSDLYKAGEGEGGWAYSEPIEAAQQQSGGGSYSGRTMSAANLARYAKDHGMTVEQAKASDELKGVTIR